MRVLFVKLTSMGDLIHALPAITDAASMIPGISFDWVIDETFSEVAVWHPAVKNIITTSHRKWKKEPWQAFKKGEIQHFLKSIRKEKYDFVIDGQTSSKSALVMFLTKGLRCGLDKNSAREWIAHLAYQKSYFVDKNMHAIRRLRVLFAQIFNYSYVDNQPNYGIVDYPFPTTPFSSLQPYIVFVHNASWQSKLWPEKYGHRLIELAAQEGLNVILTWGNISEKNRAERLSANYPNAKVLPSHTLSELAYILKKSKGAICCDTGISHLAAALNVPAVTMYGPTSAKFIGTTGLHQQHFISPFSCTMCYEHQCHYANQLHEEPPCLLAIKPEDVWKRFMLEMNVID